MTTDNTTSSAGQPLFTPISHPVLRRHGCKHMHTFLFKREEYLSHTEDVTVSKATILPATLWSSINRKMLHNVVRFQHILKKCNMSEFTDVYIATWLKKKIIRGIEDISPEALEAYFKVPVHIRSHEGDSKCRIESTFHNYTKYFFDCNSVTLLYGSSKLPISHICMLLRSDSLTPNFKNDLAIHKSNLHKDRMDFYRLVVQQAIA